MISKILGKKKESVKEDKELVGKIAKMNLTEMRSYVRNSIKSFEVSSDGLKEIVVKLTTYLKNDDMDSKKKKVFDLILLCGASKKVTVEIVQLIQKFIETNREIVSVYDREHRDIYNSRLGDSIVLAIANIDAMSKLHNRMKVLE